MRTDKRGFTLAELLIVVGIIAILAAISIPIFTSQLEKAREAVDEANLRSAYAECSASVLSGSSADNATVALTEKDGVITATKNVVLKQTQTGWQGSVTDIAGVPIPAFAAGATVTVAVKDDGTAPTFKAVVAGG